MPFLKILGTSQVIIAQKKNRQSVLNGFHKT